MGKGIEAKRAQAAVINSLSELKEFDKIQTVRDDQKQNEIKPQKPVKFPQDKCANTEVQAINPDDAQHMGRDVWTATRWTISKRLQECKMLCGP